MQSGPLRTRRGGTTTVCHILWKKAVLLHTEAKVPIIFRLTVCSTFIQVNVTVHYQIDYPGMVLTRKNFPEFCNKIDSEPFIFKYMIIGGS